MTGFMNTLRDLSEAWIMFIVIAPAAIIAAAVIRSEAKSARSTSDGMLSLTLRAERAEQQVAALKEWARKNNHGVTPKIPPIEKINSPVRVKIRRLTSPLNPSVTNGWFLVKIDSDHTAWTKEAEEWEDEELVVRRLEKTELQCKELERQILNLTRGKTTFPVPSLLSR